MVFQKKLLIAWVRLFLWPNQPNTPSTVERFLHDSTKTPLQNLHKTFHEIQIHQVSWQVIFFFFLLQKGRSKICSFLLLSSSPLLWALPSPRSLEERETTRPRFATVVVVITTTQWRFATVISWSDGVRISIGGYCCWFSSQSLSFSLLPSLRSPPPPPSSPPCARS